MIYFILLIVLTILIVISTDFSRSLSIITISTPLSLSLSILLTEVYFNLAHQSSCSNAEFTCKEFIYAP